MVYEIAIIHLTTKPGKRKIAINKYIWIMNSNAEILSKLTDLKPTLYQEFAVKKIGLFGSYADGTFTEDSDIDILVELEKPIGWRFFTLEIYLEEIFKKKIDLVTINALKEQIRDSILEQVNFA